MCIRDRFVSLLCHCVSYSLSLYVAVVSVTACLFPLPLCQLQFVSLLCHCVSYSLSPYFNSTSVTVCSLFFTSVSIIAFPVYFTSVSVSPCQTDVIRITANTIRRHEPGRETPTWHARNIKHIESTEGTSSLKRERTVGSAGFSAEGTCFCVVGIPLQGKWREG